MSRSKWGAILIGHEADLEDWREALKLPFDPWVELTQRGTVLRSEALLTASTAIEARERVLPVIEQLNGALAVSMATRPITCGCIVEFMADGSARHHQLLEADIEIRCDVRGALTILNSDGTPRPPQPSDAQRWLQIAAIDDHLADALIYFARGDNWFDIYKGFECLFLRAGGEPEFLGLGWGDSVKIKLAKRTANKERHARIKKLPNPNPIDRKEARELLGGLIRRALQEASAVS